MSKTTRRSLLATSATAGGEIDADNTIAGDLKAGESQVPFEPAADAKFEAPCNQPFFKISVAQWSLNKLFWDQRLDNRDFGKYVREQFDLDAVEWVNQFFKDQAQDFAYLREMRQRCDDAGVKTVLVMVDGEGKIGHPDAVERKKTIENHMKWVIASKSLGGHSIRVNAESEGTWDEQRKLVADGLHQLTEYARGFGINVIVENHGGLSSNGKWLSQVIQTVGLPECGTLPDFGNFDLGDGTQYDRFRGVNELMPYAKAVSAKCFNFNADGTHKEFDFARMMRIVVSHGYRDYVGVEYEGEGDRVAGVKACVNLLKTLQTQLLA